MYAEPGPEGNSYKRGIGRQATQAAGHVVEVPGLSLHGSRRLFDGTKGRSAIDQVLDRLGAAAHAADWHDDTALNREDRLELQGAKARARGRGGPNWS